MISKFLQTERKLFHISALGQTQATGGTLCRQLGLVALAVCTLVLLPSVEGVEYVNPTSQDQYDMTLRVAEKKINEGADSRAISEVYLWGAGQCRDLGDDAKAMELFEKAVETDPDNVWAFISYGDYLMGYRGLYEYAAKAYYDAQAAIDRNPAAVKESLVRHLERSFQILHRDGKDGIPLYKSPKFSVFTHLRASYGEEFIKPLDMTDFQIGFDHELDAVLDEARDGVAYFEPLVQESLGYDAYLDSLLLINGGSITDEDEPIGGSNPDGTPTTIRTKHADNAAYRESVLQPALDRAEKLVADGTDTKENLARKAPRTRDTYSFGGDLLLRFGSPKLPYVKLACERKEVDPVSFNAYDPAMDRPIAGTFDRYSVFVGKNFHLFRSTDFFIEFEGAHSKSVQEDYTLLGQYQPEYEEEGNHLGVKTTTAFNMIPFKTIKFNLGGTLSDIENNDSDDDSGYNWFTSLRLSDYPKPTGEELLERRNRGRRSTHYEIGFVNRERDYTSDIVPTVTESVVRPYVSYEELALFNGWLDLTTVYNYTVHDFSGGRAEGNRASHRLKVIPALVPVYRLYDNDFTTGLEYLTVSFPQTMEWSDGDYDRFSSGIEIFGHYVTPFNMRIIPKIMATYSYYTELGISDWGIFAKVEIAGF